MPQSRARQDCRRSTLISTALVTCAPLGLRTALLAACAVARNLWANLPGAETDVIDDLFDCVMTSLTLRAKVLEHPLQGNAQGGEAHGPCRRVWV